MIDFIRSSIKTILEVLTDEWESIDSEAPASPTNQESTLPHNLRRIRLGLSPLLFIETTLTQMLSPEKQSTRDVCVRAGSGWKSMLSLRRESLSSHKDEYGRRGSHTLAAENDPTQVLAASREDIIHLWRDPRVQEVLLKRGIRLEHSPGL